MAFPGWSGRNTVRRRVIQMAFTAVFVLLPAFDLFRFDFIESRLFLFRQEVGLDEWTLLWLALMFSMWLIGALSLLFGRVYCAYACPQTVFSELAHDIDFLAKKIVRMMGPKLRPRLTRMISYSLIAVLSALSTAFFMAYFAPLPVVFSRLFHLDFGLWVGAIGALTTLFGFLNLVFIREKFCQSVCPYGFLQAVLEDGRSLHVAFDESTGKCINCKACERVCPMEIDIRKDAFQIECTRCGSCIDACENVLRRKKRPGLLAFDFGGIARGGWDIKRVLVTVSTLGFGLVFGIAIVKRENVTLHMTAIYEDSKVAGQTEFAESRYMLRAANRGKQPIQVAVETVGLSGSAVIQGLDDAQVLPGQERRFTLVIKLPRSEIKSTVTPFVWIVKAAGYSERFNATIYTRGKALS